MKDLRERVFRVVKSAADSALAAKVRLSLPALAGMGLLSAGAAMIYLPAGLIVAGLFCLRADSRL